MGGSVIHHLDTGKGDVNVRTRWLFHFASRVGFRSGYLVGKVFWVTNPWVRSTNAAAISEDEGESNCAKDRRIGSCMTALDITHMPQITYSPLVSCCPPKCFNYPTLTSSVAHQRNS